MELRPRPASAAGFSLIEALIATAVLGFIAIGILPLFTQAMVNNKQGADSTTVTTFSKTDLESLDTVPFDGPGMSLTPPFPQCVVAGCPTTNCWTLVGGSSLVKVEWYVQQSSGAMGGTNGQWCPGGATAPTGLGQVLWKRTTTVQQYNVTDLAFANPEPSGTSPDFVHLKRIQVVVQRPSPGMPATAGKTITLQLVRAE